MLATPAFPPGSDGRRFLANAMRMIPGPGEAYMADAAKSGFDPIAGVCESPIERAADGLGAAAGPLLRIAEELAALRGGCFVAGTPVQMADGTTKSIEQIVAGDLVLSRDQNAGADGKVVASRVTRTYQHGHPSEQMVTVTLSSGERIECTDNHPFFVPGSGWIPAGKLCLGTQVTPRAGPDAAKTVMARVTVVSVVAVATKAGSTVEVFNFEVEGTHTYFVGAANGGEWVHNSCYRDTFFTAHPELNPSEWWVHHAIPQKVFDKFPGLFPAALRDDISNLRGIHTSVNTEIHSTDIGTLWTRFFAAHPNPTAAQVLKLRDFIDTIYASHFVR